MKTIALYSVKGGVGKTATAVNLAYLAAMEGKPTLIVDLDSQGSSTFYFRVKPSNRFKAAALVEGRRRKVSKQIRETDFPGLDLLPANLSFRKLDLALENSRRSKRRLSLLLSKLSKHYAYVFLDCPPNLTMLSENVFRAADVVASPAIPTTLSYRAHLQLVDFFKREDLDGRKLRPFFSMVNSAKKLHKEYMARFREVDKRVLKTVIPNSTLVERMGVQRAPLTYKRPRSKAADCYRRLWDEIRPR